MTYRMFTISVSGWDRRLFELGEAERPLRSVITLKTGRSRSVDRVGQGRQKVLEAHGSVRGNRPATMSETIPRGWQMDWGYPMRGSEERFR